MAQGDDGHTSATFQLKDTLRSDDSNTAAHNGNTMSTVDLTEPAGKPPQVEEEITESPFKSPGTS